MIDTITPTDRPRAAQKPDVEITASRLFPPWLASIGSSLVIDAQSNKVAASGLSMPHSARMYQDKLWVLRAGTGEFGNVDEDTGAMIPLCFLPGFARARSKGSFSGLNLDARLTAVGIQAQTGLHVVHLSA